MQVKNKNKVKPTVTYDMGCQKRASDSRYDSSIGHALIIGGKTKVSLEWFYIPGLTEV